tara:strand:+ start:26 stop:472 length:447 start_codon:yes stop_codon:yes gene_type:complete
MELKPLLLIFFISCIVFCDNKSFENYNELIDMYPEFSKTNFFEDSGNYYFMKRVDLVNNDADGHKSKKQISKVRLAALADLMHSVCCGFDINKYNDKNLIYDFKVSGTIKDVYTLLDCKFNNEIIYAVKASKEVFNSIDNCDCKIITN